MYTYVHKARPADDWRCSSVLSSLTHRWMRPSGFSLDQQADLLLLGSSCHGRKRDWGQAPGQEQQPQLPKRNWKSLSEHGPAHVCLSVLQTRFVYFEKCGKTTVFQLSVLLLCKQNGFKYSSSQEGQIYKKDNHSCSQTITMIILTIQMTK